MSQELFCLSRRQKIAIFCYCDLLLLRSLAIAMLAIAIFCNCNLLLLRSFAIAIFCYCDLLLLRSLAIAISCYCDLLLLRSLAIAISCYCDLAVSQLCRVEPRTVCVVMCLHIHKTGLPWFGTLYLSSDSRGLRLFLVLTVSRDCYLSLLLSLASATSITAYFVGWWWQSQAFLRTVICLHMHKTGWTCQEALRPLRNLATTSRFSPLLSFDCYSCLSSLLSFAISVFDCCGLSLTLVTSRFLCLFQVPVSVFWGFIFRYLLSLAFIVSRYIVSCIVVCCLAVLLPCCL